MDESKLKGIICKMFLGGDTSYPISADMDLVGEGILDSLSMVRLVLELENQWPGLNIQDQDITRENFQSIGAILRYLEGK